MVSRRKQLQPKRILFSDQQSSSKRRKQNSPQKLTFNDTLDIIDDDFAVFSSELEAVINLIPPMEHGQVSSEDSDLSDIDQIRNPSHLPSGILRTEAEIVNFTDDSDATDECNDLDFNDLLLAKNSRNWVDSNLFSPSFRVGNIEVGDQSRFHESRSLMNSPLDCFNLFSMTIFSLC